MQNPATCHTDSIKYMPRSLSFALRGIVLASHLKPLERKDKIGGKRTVPWNCHTTQGRTSQDETTEISRVGEAQPLQANWILCPKPPILSSYCTYFLLISPVKPTEAGFCLQSQKGKQPANGEAELNWAKQVRKVGEASPLLSVLCFAFSDQTWVALPLA